MDPQSLKVPEYAVNYKGNQDRARKRSSKYRAKRQTLVNQKFQMYFQKAENETQAGYLK